MAPLVKQKQPLRHCSFDAIHFFALCFGAFALLIPFMTAEIMAIGNEGFQIKAGGKIILIDAFYHSAPWVGSAPCMRGKDFTAADFILVTHSHADHFHEPDVLELAMRTGAVVAGPPSVTERLVGKLPGTQIACFNPHRPDEGRTATGDSRQFGHVKVTAFGTFHSREHNSYLVETPEFSFFHDGDNEDTTRINPAAPGKLDALFIGPWQGSGWPEFITRLAPKHWFVMHLTKSELDDEANGNFLSTLCAKVPEGLVTLCPGQVYSIQ